MKEKTIYALGIFDGVHAGHGALLKACRVLADEKGCKAGVVTFTGHPDTLVLGKSPSLINSPEDRKRLLRERFSVDTVIALPFDRQLMTMPWQDFFRLLVDQYGAAGLVCGHDFRFGNKGEGNGQRLMEACAGEGICCAVIPEQKIDGITVSSTHIRQLLENGEMAQAVRFLGHPHEITGTVVYGRRLGRTIGIPTANIRLSEGVVCPKHGVYACKAVVDGREYSAVTNIGNRPTVGGHHVTVEAWLLDFEGDLYGKELRLLFHAFLRPEEKFDSLAQLQAEIQKNAQQVRKIFGKQ